MVNKNKTDSNGKVTSKRKVKKKLSSTNQRMYIKKLWKGIQNNNYQTQKLKEDGLKFFDNYVLELANRMTDIAEMLTKQKNQKTLSLKSAKCACEIVTKSIYSNDVNGGILSNLVNECTREKVLAYDKYKTIQDKLRKDESESKIKE